MCDRCAAHEITYVSASNAKKQWLLEEGDLAILTCKQKRRNTMFPVCRLYDLKEVKQMAMVKHGGFSAFMQQKNGSKPMSKARMQRQARLAEVAKHDRDVAEAMGGGDMGALCVDMYLMNGSGGMGQVKERVRRWVGFDDLTHALTAEDPSGMALLSLAVLEDIRDDYVLGKVATDMDVKNKIHAKIIVARERRRK